MRILTAPVGRASRRACKVDDIKMTAKKYSAGLPRTWPEAIDDIDFGDEIPQQPTPIASAAAQGPASVEGPDQELAQVLGPVLKRPGALRDGAAFILCLQEIRRRLGARWETACERLYHVMETAIHEQLVSGDALVRLSAHRYLLAFGATTGRNAEERAGIIARRVKEKLFGTSSSAEVQVIAYGKDGLGAAIAPPPGLVPASHTVPPPALTRALNVADAPEFRYVPIWDAAHKVLSNYMCVPVHISRAGHAIFGHTLVPPGSSDAEIAAFDAQTLNHVIDVADTLYRHQFGVLISFSVDYRTLGNSKSRQIFIAACQRIPKHLRNLIIAEIADVPRAVPPSTLAERAGLLKPFFRLLMLEIPSLDESLSRLSYLGLHGVTFNIWRFPKAAINDAQVKRAVQDAKSARLKLAMSGIATTAQAHQFATLGVTYLSGSFIGEMLALPGARQSAAFNDLGRAAEG